jgi:dipeptidyl aminopeptidase/acylaminoacyl peptidase
MKHLKSVGLSVSVAALLALAGCASSHSTNTSARADAGSSGSTGGIAAAPGLVERGPGVEKFYRIRTPAAARIKQDGTLYCIDWPDGVRQLYRVRPPLDKPAIAMAGVQMERMTDFKDGITGYTISPDGSRTLVYTAMGGNENTQVYVLDQNTPIATGGGLSNLTPLLVNPKAMFRISLWSNDSSAFYYTSNDTDANNFHMYRYDFASNKPTKILAKDGDWTAADVTRDGKRVMVLQYRSSSDSEISELDVATGNLRSLNSLVVSGGQTASIEPVGYTPDEKGFYIVSDHEEGIKRLFLIDLASGKLSKPLPTLDKYELDGAGINEARTFMGVTANEDGYGVIRLYRLPTLEEVKLPEIERGVVGFAELEDNRVSWTLSNARTQGNMFTWNIPAAGQPAERPRQVTFSDNQGIDLSKFTLPELVEVTSFDGMKIPAFVYLPTGAKKGQPIPFVVDYHGGPEAQYRPDFSAFVQYLLSEGFGVMRPNVRGSSGYGRAFIMADDYKLRWNAVKDGWHCAKWLVDNGYGTPGKIASYGGSYGGFMTTAVQVEDQEAFERGQVQQRLFGASINVVGVINFQTFLERTSGYRRKLREVEYGPLTDPDFLNSVSPLLRSDKINVPMLIAHGANDPRVPVTEAMQMAEALMRRGMDPEQIYFDDEGHGFAKLDNRLLFAKRASRFLKQHIGQ